MRSRYKKYDDTQRLDSLKPGMELSYEWGEEAAGFWCVHRVHGSRNDRQWTLIGKGTTVHEAIDAAIYTTTLDRK